VDIDEAILVSQKFYYFRHRGVMECSCNAEVRLRDGSVIKFCCPVHDYRSPYYRGNHCCCEYHRDSRNMDNGHLKDCKLIALMNELKGEKDAKIESIQDDVQG
jgi:hypothetical protein